MDCSYLNPLSMGFSRQEYWSRLHFPSPGDLPDPGIRPWSPTLQAGALLFEPQGKPSFRMLLLSHFSLVRLLATLWIVVYQAPPSMGFSRQEYWSRVPSPSPSFRMVCCKYLTNRTTSSLPVILLSACDERVKSACIQEIHNPLGRRDTLASLTCISSQV